MPALEMNKMITSAQQVVTLGAAGTGLPVSRATGLGVKATWLGQLTGLYELIFPLIKEDFPDRLDLINYVGNCFIEHDSQKGHDGAYSTRFPDVPATKIQEKVTNLMRIQPISKQDSIEPLFIKTPNLPTETEIVKLGLGI